jgi:1-acyl-sn-glycerol-3-phosphate acyltransferase
MVRSSVKHQIFWWMAQASIGIRVLLQYRIKPIWHSKPPKKQPYILVANHANRTDPFIIGRHLRTPINYMANVEGVSGLRQVFSSGLGCFNIRKGRPDAQAFANAMGLLKKAYSIGIFVEGDRCWTGQTKRFSTATASLAIKIGVPVLMARLSGNYMSRPRWAEIPRRGKIFVEFDLISASEVQKMSKEEITERIFNYINTDEFEAPLLKGVEFKGKKLAVGAENILWLCPSCGLEDKMQGSGNSIACRSCGYACSIDANQRLTDSTGALQKKRIANIRDWALWQMDWARKKIETAEGKPFLADSKAELIEEPSPGVWKSLGTGELRLSRDGLYWKPHNGTEPVFAAAADILNIVDNFNQYSIINLKRIRYRVYFGTSCGYKWQSFHELMQGGQN